MLESLSYYLSPYFIFDMLDSILDFVSQLIRNVLGTF